MDGCKGGWLGVRLSGAEGWSANVFSHFSELVEVWSAGDPLVLIDIPIGLPQHDSHRRCDAEARAYLGSPRASSVFNPPTRAALAGVDWE